MPNEPAHRSRTMRVGQRMATSLQSQPPRQESHGVWSCSSCFLPFDVSVAGAFSFLAASHRQGIVASPQHPQRPSKVKLAKLGTKAHFSPVTVPNMERKIKGRGNGEKAGSQCASPVLR